MSGLVWLKTVPVSASIRIAERSAGNGAALALLTPQPRAFFFGCALFRVAVLRNVAFGGGMRHGVVRVPRFMPFLASAEAVGRRREQQRQTRQRDNGRLRRAPARTSPRIGRQPRNQSPAAR